MSDESFAESHALMAYLAQRRDFGPEDAGQAALFRAGKVSRKHPAVGVVYPLPTGRPSLGQEPTLAREHGRAERPALSQADGQDRRGEAEGDSGKDREAVEVALNHAGRGGGGT